MRVRPAAPINVPLPANRSHCETYIMAYATNQALMAPPTPEGAAVATVRIEPSRGWLDLRLREVWSYRELLYFFVWRDVKVRYKQTAIGVLWVILQPMLNMLVFTLFF